MEKPIIFISHIYFAQYQPKNMSSADRKKANDWVDKTYQSCQL